MADAQGGDPAAQGNWIDQGIREPALLDGCPRKGAFHRHRKDLARLGARLVIPRGLAQEECDAGNRFPILENDAGDCRAQMDDVWLRNARGQAGGKDQG